MSAVVTDKQTGSARNVAGDTVVLSGASVITVQASPEDIASYQRSGDDLVPVSYTHLTLPTTPYV